jgi:hypothetical protein
MWRKAALIRIKTVHNTGARTSGFMSVTAALRSLSEGKPLGFGIRWEYSSKNTRFQIDQPK